MPVAILAALAITPVALLLFLRTNAAVVFLALCAGSILPSYVGEDANLIVSSFFPGSSAGAYQVISIVLILLPAVLTALFLRNSLSGVGSILNIPTTIAVGLFIPLLVVPYLSDGLRVAIEATEVWELLEQFQAVIVGGGILFSLVLLWAAFKKGHSKKGKKYH